MTDTIHPYTSEQMAAWLRGLLTLAWADGDFDAAEQQLIGTLTQDIAPNVDLGTVETIAPDELALALGSDRLVRENFLRTAVMVVIADGIYSYSEDKLLRQYCKALKLESKPLDSLRQTLESSEPKTRTEGLASQYLHRDTLKPVREWLDGMDINDPRLARFMCKMIPAQCPFERDIKLFGKKVVHIPPLCKLNPLYEQLVGLRFRALSYLADERGEDISSYC